LDINSLERAELLENLERNEVGAALSMPLALNQRLHPRWQDWFSDFIEGGRKEINKDHRPIGFVYDIAYWNSLYTPELRWLFDKMKEVRFLQCMALLLILLLLYLFIRRVKPNLFTTSLPFSIGTTGFCGMVFTLSVIFTFQNVFGHLFAWIGLLTAFYMTGSSCGAVGMISFQKTIKESRKVFIVLELIIGVFALLLGLILYISLTLQLSGGIYTGLKIVFLLTSFLAGIVVGVQFPLGNKLSLEKSGVLSKTAGLMYASDLLGGWLGGIAGAIILLPVLGLYNTFVFVALLKALSCLMYSFQSREEVGRTRML
jgi:spermidine synthase